MCADQLAIDEELHSPAGRHRAADPHGQRQLLALAGAGGGLKRGDHHIGAWLSGQREYIDRHATQGSQAGGFDSTTTIFGPISKQYQPLLAVGGQ